MGYESWDVENDHPPKDALDTSHANKQVELVLDRTEVHLELVCNGSKRKVNMIVLGGVDIGDVHGEAITIPIEGFEVCDPPECFWWFRDKNTRTTMRDAPVGTRATVPGAPVRDFVMVQNSSVMPHWPQISQQAFSGHGLRSARDLPSVGGCVPGTCGPHTAFETGAGMGGVPLLRYILIPACRSSQPIQPQVFLL